MGKANEGMYIYRRSCRSLYLMLSCLTVLFSCGVVYSRGNRTAESEKKQTSVYLIKRKMKKIFFIRTWHTHTGVHLSTGGRHQVKMQQTWSEPPNRNPPELLEIHTSHIHTLFRHRRQHHVCVSPHIRTRYVTEGSVQQHPPPYSFRRRVKIKK